MVTIDLHPAPRTLRGFTRGWFPLFVVALGAILNWRFDAEMAAMSVWVGGALVAAAALASGAVARRVYIALTVVTFPIAIVVSTVILAVMFYLVITPLGMLLRLRGHDPLRLRRRDAGSHWERCAEDNDPGRAVRQF